MANAKKRLFIIDSSCGANTTHNPISMNSVYDYIGHLFDEVFYIAPHKHSFHHNHVNFVECFVPPFTKKSKKKSFYNRFRLFKVYEKVLQFCKIDIAKYLCSMQFKKICNFYQVGRNDVFFLPSASYYCINSVMSYAINAKNKSPKIHCKLVNVLDFVSIKKNYFTNNLDKTSLLIAKARKILKEEKIIISTETQNYANFLKHKNIKIDYVNLMIKISTHENKDDTINVNRSFYNIFLPGMQLRNDKGFFTFLSIVEIFCKKYNSNFAKINFIIQNPEELERYNKNLYFLKLLNTGKVTYVASKLSNQDLLFLYNSCDLILLPYQTQFFNPKYNMDSYEFKGSGIVAEALNFKKNLVISNNIAIKSFVESYDSGILCDNNPVAFADAIYNAMQMDTQELDKRLETAKQKYEADLQDLVKRYFI